MSDKTKFIISFPFAVIATIGSYFLLEANIPKDLFFFQYFEYIFPVLLFVFILTLKNTEVEFFIETFELNKKLVYSSNYGNEYDYEMLWPFIFRCIVSLYLSLGILLCFSDIIYGLIFGIISLLITYKVSELIVGFILTFLFFLFCFIFSIPERIDKIFTIEDYKIKTT